MRYTAVVVSKCIQWSFIVVFCLVACGGPKPQPSPILSYPHPTLDHNITMINQGVYGDCWFEATLASITYAQPNYLDSRIFTNPNGSWDIMFNDVYSDGNIFVNVNLDDLSKWSGNMENQNTLNWPAIFEIAYTKTSVRDANRIKNGGQPIDAFMALGNEANISQYFLDQNTGQQMYGVYQDATKNPTAISTLGNNQEYAVEPIISGHAYAVLGANNGNVLLFNPWGVLEGGKNPNDLIFIQPPLHAVLNSTQETDQETF